MSKLKISLIIYIAAILLLDQLTKILIVNLVEDYYLRGHTIEVLGDFLRIIHVRNTAAAFSLGSSFSPQLRQFFFASIPTIFIIGLIIYLFKNKQLFNIHRWALATIIGGGLGNQVDRIFRADGVVDFIDFKFYNIFGMARWPTFNVADMCIVCGTILFILTLIMYTKKMQANEKKTPIQDGEHHSE